jgi:hypothetical protein
VPRWANKTKQIMVDGKEYTVTILPPGNAEGSEECSQEHFGDDIERHMSRRHDPQAQAFDQRSKVYRKWPDKLTVFRSPVDEKIE